jgi:integrase
MSVFEKLTAKRVENIKTPGRICDGRGLYLQTSKLGEEITKAWLYRYTLNGRARAMGLGPYPDVSLAKARSKAQVQRELLADGLDPLEVKHRERAAARVKAAKTVTFAHCAEKYLAVHGQAWKNAVHRAQWKSTLQKFAFPIIGNLPVSEIDTAHVVRVIEPHWSTKTETASRVRLRVEKILDWARVRGFRAGENPARWRGHLDSLLPSPKKIKKVQHFRALAYADMPAFMAELRNRDGVSARALELLILTATRTSEIVHAKWSEFDLKQKVWAIPAHRMKAGRPHRVPLSDRAVEILNGLPTEKGNPFVFIGTKKDQSINSSAMLQLMRDLRPGYVPHGCRSTFRDWCAEQTNYPREVCEAALAHAVEDRVEAAYKRTDFFERRARLMADWARFCTRAPSRPADVTDLAKIRRKRHG